MHDLYKLKEMLVRELESFGKKGELTKTSLTAIDTLAHATKNLVKVIEACEQDGYSNAMSRSYGYDNSYAHEVYSRAEDSVKERLHRLMNSTSDGRTKEEIRKMIDNM